MFGVGSVDVFGRVSNTRVNPKRFIYAFGKGAEAALNAQTVVLSADTEILPERAATVNAQLVIYIQQNDTTPFNITWGDGFKAGTSTNLTPTLSAWNVFTFIGRDDGADVLWWPIGRVVIEA